MRRPTGTCHAADAKRIFVHERTVVDKPVKRPPRYKRNEDKLPSFCVFIEIRLEKRPFEDLIATIYEHHYQMWSTLFNSISNFSLTAREVSAMMIGCNGSWSYIRCIFKRFLQNWPDNPGTQPVQFNHSGGLYHNSIYFPHGSSERARCGELDS